MGMEISIVKTKSNINLGELYMILDILEDCFDWYLGKDEDDKPKKWIELNKFCQSLTKNAILAKIQENNKPKRMSEFIKGLSERKFAFYLILIYNSISEHETGNSHLFFDRNRLPMSEDLVYSSSNILRNLFLSCKHDIWNGPIGDYVVELDKNKILTMYNTWGKYRFKLKLSKWIGYFMPTIGRRILDDCIEDLNVFDSYIEVKDMEYYLRTIENVAKDIEQETDTFTKLWLISSY